MAFFTVHNNIGSFCIFYTDAMLVSKLPHQDLFGSASYSSTCDSTRFHGSLSESCDKEFLLPYFHVFFFFTFLHTRSAHFDHLYNRQWHNLGLQLKH